MFGGAFGVRYGHLLDIWKEKEGAGGSVQSVLTMQSDQLNNGDEMGRHVESRGCAVNARTEWEITIDKCASAGTDSCNHEGKFIRQA